MAGWAVAGDTSRRTGRRRIFDPLVTLTSELLMGRATRHTTLTVSLQLSVTECVRPRCVPNAHTYISIYAKLEPSVHDPLVR